MISSSTLQLFVDTEINFYNILTHLLKECLEFITFVFFSVGAIIEVGGFGNKIKEENN